jgi:RNA polymerase sigma-32 factor
MFPIDNSIAAYITRVRSLPILSREEEVRLCKAWRDNQDYSARDQILQANLRHASAVALQFRRYPIPLEDLLSEANLGLMKAIDSHYDPDSGNRFITFAVYWIRAYVFRYIIKCQNESNTVADFRSRDYFKFQKEKVKAYNRYRSREEVEQALVESMGMPLDKVQKLMMATEGRDLSLAVDIHGDRGGDPVELVETLVSDSQSQDEYLDDTNRQNRYRAAVQKALKDLSPRELIIVKDRLMQDPESAKTLKEIGEKFGVSRERTRQLEVKAVKKLRLRLESLRGSV